VKPASPGLADSATFLHVAGRRMYQHQQQQRAGPVTWEVVQLEREVLEVDERRAIAGRQFVHGIGRR